ncbi:glycosyltransferase family A protein [Salinicola salarius]|uniref:glycosyltransferase family A protein n=1 Tax=Salinicola salarius TaxID=430457 RepID=UPI0023E479AA|nr:glycosyltransferase family A protein [Salinicola salarius]MDF3917786.1 glycosyltransferase family A protein [Salinicola salarius]
MSFWQALHEPSLFNQHFHNILPVRKDDIVEFIYKFSFDVPTVAERKEILRVWSDDSKNASASVVVAVVLSTAQVRELSDISVLLGNLLSRCLSNTNSELVLDYVLASDWGKILALDSNRQANIISLMVESERYKYSDDISVLFMKLATQSSCREIIINSVGVKRYADFCLELFSKAKGRTGGLLKQAAFLLRREKVLGPERVSMDVEKLIEFIKKEKLDSMSAFSVVSISSRLSYVKLASVVNYLKSYSEEAAELCCYSLSKPYLIWHEIQSKCVRLDIPPYSLNAIREKSLNEFYVSLSRDIPKRKFRGDDKIGAIITTYNPDVKKLKTSILSVLSQSYSNTRVILVDDNSDGDFKDSISNLVASIDSDQITFIRNKENKGQYISRNIAIENNLDCQYFAIQDDDDFSHPERFSEQLALLKSSNDYKLVMCLQARFTEDMIYVPDRHHPVIFDKSPATSMFSLKTFLSLGGFSNVRTRGDTEYIQRVKNHYGNNSVVSIDAPLYLMRSTGNTISASKDRTLKTQLDVFRYEMRKPALTSGEVSTPWALIK